MRAADLAWFFKATTLRDIADHGVGSVHRKCLSQGVDIAQHDTLRNVLRFAYSTIRKDYPIEYVIKNEMLHNLRADMPEGYIATEKGMHQHKADIIAVTETRSVAYEIKTQYDRPTRLSNQIDDYYKIFDEVVLVCSEGYTLRYAKYVPETVGLIAVTRDGDLNVLRDSTKYSDQLVVCNMLCSMRKRERLACLKDLYPYHTDHEAYSYSLTIHCDHTPETVLPVMQKHMSKTELIRCLGLSDHLPHTLMAAMYDYRMTKGDWSKIISLLDHPIVGG